jgi:hypothetical protein
MSAQSATNRPSELARLAAQWRTVTARANRPDAPEDACSEECEVAEALAWSISGTPALSLPDLLIKLRVYRAEIEAGASALADALLGAIIADTARLSTADAPEREAPPAPGGRNRHLLALS